MREAHNATEIYGQHVGRGVLRVADLVLETGAGIAVEELPGIGTGLSQRIGAAVLDQIEAQAFAPAPCLDIGEAGQLAAVKYGSVLPGGLKGVVGLFVDRLLPARHIAGEVGDVAACADRQAIPLSLGNLLGSSAPRIGDDDANGLNQPPRPLRRLGAPQRRQDLVTDLAVGRGQLGTRLFALENELALRRVGGVVWHEELEPDAAQRGLLARVALAVRQQHDVLQEGIAQLLIDKTQLQALDRHHAAKVDLDPPTLDGIAWVRFPEGRRVAVEDVGGSSRIGPDSTDAGPHPVVEHQLTQRIRDRRAEDVQLIGAVDSADTRVRIADHNQTPELEVVEDIVDHPEGASTYRTDALDVGQVLGDRPLVPVAGAVDDHLVAGDLVSALSSDRTENAHDQ